jgi:hypothetical protein
MKETAVYVLWDGRRDYYVGCTRDYNRRLAQHVQGLGSRTTKQWRQTGRKVLEYWKLVVTVPVVQSGCYQQDGELRLEELEKLVLDTLRRQNPQCVVSM